MPLVIMCGYPASGKTTRTTELKTFISDKYPQRSVHVVSDHCLELEVNRNDVYVSSQKEKEVRGSLKSAVQRILNKDDVVILDSLNYIKGFRYELYCMSKSCQTTHCVVMCDANKDCVTERNAQREGDDKREAYDSDVLDALVMRFEAPNSANRWDNPLFMVQADDVLPSEDICAALFERKAPKPNLSTQSQPLSSTNFLYELDRVAKEVVSLILDAQKTSAPGDMLTVPGTKEQLTLTRTVTLSELQRHKRQFITYTKMHPVEDTAKLYGLFVQYLNNALSV